MQAFFSLRSGSPRPEEQHRFGCWHSRAISGEGWHRSSRDLHSQWANNAGRMCRSAYPYLKLQSCPFTVFIFEPLSEHIPLLPFSWEGL